MRRESAGNKHMIPDHRQTKEITLQELLDRDSRQKPIRKPRENVVPDLKGGKEGTDKNLRINNLQKEFEELKNKIKHVQNKNERILTKLKSFKDQSREKSRSKTNQSINKGDILPKLGTPLGSHQMQPLLTTLGQIAPNSIAFTNDQRGETRDPYLIQFRRDNSTSHYNVLADENMSLQETNELLKMRLEKNERMMVEKNQIYEQKEAFYKDLLSNKEQQIERLKDARGKADFRKLIDFITTTERMNAETRSLLERRIKDLTDRLSRVCKLVKLSERTIKQNRRRPDQKESVEFFNLKEKQLEMIIDELQKDQRKLRIQNAQTVKEAQQFKVKLENLRESHQQELRELRNKYTARMSTIQKKYTDEIKQNAQELVQLKHDRDDALEQLTDEKLLSTKIKKQLQQSDERVKKTEVRYNTLIEDLRIEITTLRDSLSKSEQQKQSIQFQLDKIKVGRSLKIETDILAGNHAQKQQLTNQIRALKSSIEKLENQLNGLKRQNWELNLKLKKKDEFKIQLQQTYKQKLQQQAKTISMVREDKRKLELEIAQIRSQITNDAAIRQRNERQILQEIELMCVLEAENDCTLKSILETYRNQPLSLAVEAMKAISDKKRLEAQDRQRVMKMIDPKKFQPLGTKRFEMQAIDYLTHTLASMTTQIRLKDQASQQFETRSKWEKELLEQEISKLKKSNQDLKRQRQKDDQEKKLRKNEAALVKESLEEQQKERYTQMRALILKSETDKKELEKRLKMMQFQMDEARDSYQELIRRKDRLQADKDRILNDFQKRLQDKDERIEKCEGELREMKEDTLKKKREYVAQLRKLQYQSSEKIAQLQHELEEKQSQIALKDEQIVLLTNQNNSISSSFNAYKAKSGKETTQTQRLLKQSLAKKDQELKAKAAELAQTSALVQENKKKQAQLEAQFKGKNTAQEGLKSALQKEKERISALQKARQEDKAEYQQKLRLKKQNQELLSKRLQLKNAQSTRYYQEIKDLKQKQQEAAEANKTVKTEIASLKSECEKLQDRLLQKQSALITNEQKLRQIQEARKTADERAEELHQTHLTRIKKLQASLKAAEEQTTTHEQELDSIRSNLHQKQMQLAKLARDTSGIRQQLIEKDAQIDQLKQLNEKAMGSNQGLKKQAEQYSSMLKAAQLKQSQIDKLQKDLDVVASQKGELEQKVRHLTQSLNKIQTKASKAEITFQQTLQSQKLAFQQRIQDLKKSLQRERANAVQAISHEKSMLVEQTTHTQLKLKSELTALEDDLRLVKKDLEIAQVQLKSRTEQAELDLKKIRIELQNQHTQKEQAEREIKKLTQQMYSLRKQLQDNKRKSPIEVQDEQMLLSPSRTPPASLPQSESIKETKQVKQQSKLQPEKTLSDNVHFFEIGQEQPSQKKQQGGMSDTQLKQFFSRVRIEIEKVLNQQEISVQIFEIMPMELETDFQELICEIRNRIMELNQKAQKQQLSFIYVDQYQEDYFGDSLIKDFPELAPVADTKQLLELKQKISQQQRVIQNLTNQKQHNQNTINQMAQQKEEAEEQNEARYITQLGVLKRELKEFKDRIDALDMLLAATKKSLFRILEVLFSENTHLEQDLAQSFNYYMSIVKLPDKQKQLLNTYFQKYVEKNKAKSKRSWFS